MQESGLGARVGSRMGPNRCNLELLPLQATLSYNVIPNTLSTGEADDRVQDTEARMVTRKPARIPNSRDPVVCPVLPTP